eukprot:CAMPEP_0184715092 /NCGR_PEP_ID=MMETSP0314-20130426/5086_1 /TAXON_ID=38298 /ORGANISM="Rhodella maculata, Strain CCMP 736" /LENGTH=67 /DNA_ID=CAMNT_0027178147 /DNA_START=874 /DNA_END=1074 /DNA_ORIENTATION=+
MNSHRNSFLGRHLLKDVALKHPLRYLRWVCALDGSSSKPPFSEWTPGPSTPPRNQASRTPIASYEEH